MRGCEEARESISALIAIRSKRDVPPGLPPCVVPAGGLKLPARPHSDRQARIIAVFLRALTAPMCMTEQEIREVTKKAVSAVSDDSLPVPKAAAASRSALSPLPGFARGDALALALLLAAAPERMAVYDRRAQTGLETFGHTLSPAPGRYSR
jgi:hypothetical protein